MPGSRHYFPPAHRNHRAIHFARGASVIWLLLLCLLLPGCSKELEELKDKHAELEKNHKNQSDEITRLKEENAKLKTRIEESRVGDADQKKREYENLKQAIDDERRQEKERIELLREKAAKYDLMQKAADDRDTAIQDKVTYFNIASIVLVCFLGIGMLLAASLWWDNNNKKKRLESEQAKLRTLQDIARDLSDAIGSNQPPETIAAFGKAARDIRDGIEYIRPVTQKDEPRTRTQELQ